MMKKKREELSEIGERFLDSAQQIHYLTENWELKIFKMKATAAAKK